MARHDLILFEEDQRRLTEALQRLCAEARGRAVFLIDKSGRLLAVAGAPGEIDTTTLASLTAGSVAATTGLAQLLGEREFIALVHEGERESLHVTLVGDEAILVVLFDRQTPLGLVRLRVRRAGEELAGVLAAAGSRSSGPGPAVQFTDEDIENLLSA
jgi:predicted regulator of Ras-like GTPase activity (Roadblock/LC7/MglB family)